MGREGAPEPKARITATPPAKASTKVSLPPMPAPSASSIVASPRGRAAFDRAPESALRLF